jgi:hypothetical protein
MIIMACFISPAQRVAIFQLNFDLLRVMVIFGTLRILLKGEWRGFQWKALDSVLLLWAGWKFFAGLLLFASPEFIKNALGVLYDALGMYFLFRCLVRTREDLEQLARGCAAISIPVALAFLVEFSTGRNMFAALGGVSEITEIRNGRLRCQGAFAHPILAGCFWATLMPLMSLLWWRGKTGKLAAIVGITSAGVIVVTCSSSTPVMTLIFISLAACLFPLRRWMRFIRWSLLFVIIGLHLVMKAPVWELIARIDIVSGSTGWHRFYLIDNFIRRADEWFFLGSSVGTAHWGYGQEDVTNLYIVQGLHGGIVLLSLFIALISFGFRAAGRMVRYGRTSADTRLGWILGVSLFAHVMNYFAVSYFGQINMIWFLLLAMLGSLSPLRVPAKTLTRPAMPQLRAGPRLA